MKAVSEQGTSATMLDGNESEVIGVIVTRWIQASGTHVEVTGKDGSIVNLLDVGERLLSKEPIGLVRWQAYCRCTGGLGLFRDGWYDAADEAHAHTLSTDGKIRSCIEVTRTEWIES